MSGEDIFSLIFWGFWIVAALIVVYVTIEDANHGVTSYRKPFIEDDMSPQEKWHRSVTLFGNPTPWDDDHYR